MGISCQVAAGHPLPRFPNTMHSMSHEEDSVVDSSKEGRHLRRQISARGATMTSSKQDANDECSSSVHHHLLWL